MSKYERIAPARAADPVEHMRLYARDSAGRHVVVVVHEVRDGTVYYAGRRRGVRGGTFHGWGLYRRELADWAAQAPTALACRLPRIEAGPLRSGGRMANDG